MNTKRKTTVAGFTLVENLLVMAVMAFLAAILFTVFARVRERGRNSVCQINLKQLALSIQQYTQDHDGRYPGANISKATPGMAGTNRFTTWTADISSYVRNPQIFVCPTRDRIGGITSPHYSFNIVRLNTYSASLRQAAGRHEAVVPDASQVWVNTDEDNIATGFETDDLPYSFPSGCGWSSNWGQTLHSGGANYSFADGHVKWLTPQQIQDIECGLGATQFRTS